MCSQDRELLMDVNYEYYKNLALEDINSDRLFRIIYNVLLTKDKIMMFIWTLFTTFNLQECRETASLFEELMLQEWGEDLHLEKQQERRAEWYKKINAK